MTIKINISSKFTVRKDGDRATHPCEVIIRGTHNHNLESASALQELRVTQKTRNTSFKYFDQGKLYDSSVLI